MFLAGAASGSSPSGDSSSEDSPNPLETFRQAISEAEESLQVGELQLAESRFRTALFEGWMILGSLAEASGDMQGAKRAYDSAIDSVVDVRRARIALVGVFRETEEYEEAEALLRLLIAQDKNDFLARRLLSDTLADAGQDVESIQELEQLVAMNPEDLETVYFLSTAYLAENRIEEADFLLEGLATAIPTPQTHILIGRAYRDYDFFERARRSFETAIEMDQQAPRAHYYRATVDVLDEGRNLLEPAIGYFQKELAINPGEPTTSLYLGISLTEVRRYEEAIAHLEAARQVPEFEAEAQRFLGRCFAAIGRVDEAVIAFRSALEAATSDVGQRSREEIAESKLRQFASIHFQLAQALRKLGDEEAASIHFDAAKEFQAQSIESARETLTDYLTNETATYGEKEGPISSQPAIDIDIESLRETSQKIKGAMASAYLNLGVLQAKQGNSAGAADFFEQGTGLDPESHQLQYSLGVARFNAGQFALATGPLSRALQQEPDDAQLRQMLAMAWFNAADYGKAAEMLADLPARRSILGLQYAYGVALVRSGRSAEAEEVFAELVSTNADSPELNVMLAQAHANQGDFEQAVDLLQRALVLDPQVAEAHGTLGEIFMRTGELEEAERELRSELRMHPGDTRTMYTLATVLDMAQKPSEAMTLLESLLVLEPKLGKGRYLLGKVLLGEGFLDEALEQLQAAVELIPDDANVHYQLGQVFQRLGRRDEARAEFDTFRQLKNEQR
jgi:tetratricopeptide (TPR) repeat protein